MKFMYTHTQRVCVNTFPYFHIVFSQLVHSVISDIIELVRAYRVVSVSAKEEW